MNNELLIELVYDNEILYDFNDKNYHDTEKKDIVWRNIAEKLRVPEKECRKQWNSLRDSFRRNLKKRKRTSSQGSGITKKWKFENEMSFLIPYFKNRETISSLESRSPIHEEAEETGNATVKNEITNSSQTETEKDEDDETEININLPEKPRKLFKKRSNQQQTAVSMMMKYILEEKSKSNNKDEIEMLFYSLSRTVKKLPPYYQALAKSKVCAIVSELEIQNLTDPVPAQHFSTPTSSPASIKMLPRESNKSNI